MIKPLRTCAFLASAFFTSHAVSCNIGATYSIESANSIMSSYASSFSAYLDERLPCRFLGSAWVMDLRDKGWSCDNAAGRYENESMSGLTLKFGNWPIEEDKDNYVVGSSTTPYLIGISAVAKSDFAINGWTITNHPSVTDMAGWFKSTFSNFDIVISEKERAVQVDLPLYRIEVPESPSSCPLGASVGMQRYPTHKYNVSIVISDMSISVSIGTYGSQFIEGCNAD